MRTRGLLIAALVAGASAAQAQQPDGRRIYEQKCAMCHGKNGSPPSFYAKKVKTLGDAAWQKSRTDAQIRKAIEEGVKGTLMASFKDAYTSEEIEALVRHIRTLDPAASPGQVRSGLSSR
jgi:mono/diheme cytochrome c family protein